MPQGSPPAGNKSSGALRQRRQRSPAYEAATARNNTLRAKGGRVLQIAMAWRLAEPAERGRYLTPLGKAVAQMLAEGVAPPDPAQVERDIEAVMSGQARAVTGRDRSEMTSSPSTLDPALAGLLLTLRAPGPSTTAGPRWKTGGATSRSAACMPHGRTGWTRTSA